MHLCARIDARIVLRSLVLVGVRAVASAIMSQPKTKMLGMPREMRAPARSDDMDVDEASSEEEQELDEDEYDDYDQGNCTVPHFDWPSETLTPTLKLK
jgi:hypothetical protein